MNKKIFNPEKYGMTVCSSCDSRGFIQNPKRRCCPTYGGFGFVIREAEQGTKDSSDGESEISLGPELSDADRYP